jgi:hypothetical protein
MKNVWIFLFLSILFKRTNAMEGDSTKNDNEFSDKNDAPKIEQVNKEKIEDIGDLLNEKMFNNENVQRKEADDFKIIKHEIIMISPDEAKTLQKSTARSAMPQKNLPKMRN